MAEIATTGTSETAVEVKTPRPVPENMNDPAIEQAGEHSQVAVQDVEKEDAEETDPTTTRAEIVRLNADAVPWPHYDSIQVQDVFCPDQQYIEQLPIPEAPRNQCNFCGETFGSERALAKHKDNDHH